MKRLWVNHRAVTGTGPEILKELHDLHDRQGVRYIRTEVECRTEGRSGIVHQCSGEHQIPGKGFEHMLPWADSLRISQLTGLPATMDLNISG
jgi:hypothetical protein